jgi:CRP/FNR family transcriptional regulator, cyclic AMP receptor protein
MEATEIGSYGEGSMEASYLWENLFIKKEKKNIQDLLRSVPMFENLSRRNLISIERILHRRTYVDGEYIFHKGEVGLGMYIIEEGEVSILVEQTQHEIARLVHGEFFGETALLTEQQRSASARAVGTTKVFGFFQPDLFSLIKTNSKIGVAVVMNLSRIVAERLYQSTIENNILRQKLQDAE